MKKILLISTNALGDTYLTCAAFKSIKDSFKKAQIDIVSTESALFFLKEVGFDNMYLLKKKSFAEVRRIISKIRDVEYDIVFNFFPGQVNSSIFKLSNAVEKIGFANFAKKKSWHNDEDVLKIKSQPKNKSIVWKPNENYLQRITLALEAAEIKNEICKHIFDFKKKENRNFDVVVHLFSSDVNRKISNESIVKIAETLCKTYKMKACILGNRNELADLKELKEIENLHLEVSPGIGKLVELISSAGLFIGVDSFPLHIADAYGVKILGIFYYPNEKSVFQNMKNKFIFRVEDTNLNAPELVKFIKEKKLLDGI